MENEKTHVFNAEDNQVAQGDVLFTRVSTLPDGLVKIEETKPDYIITHSESGHHHVMKAESVDFYRVNELVGYINVKKPTALRHLRSYRTHETVLFMPGIFRINRQAEQTPKGWERVAD